MGACTSVQDRASRDRSLSIDRTIEEDSRRFRKECKILLLGSGESGKSTIVKQMKIIHQNGYTADELMTFRTTIYKNLLESAHHILLAMRKMGLDCLNPTNRVSSTFLLPLRAPAGRRYAQPALTPPSRLI